MKITVRNILGDRPSAVFDGSEGWFVEFGDGDERLFVALGPDGKIDVRHTSAALVIEPRVANSIWVSVRK